MSLNSELIKKKYALKGMRALKRHHPYLEEITCPVCKHYHPSVTDSVYESNTDEVRIYQKGSGGAISFEIKCECPDSIKSFERTFSMASAILGRNPFIGDVEIGEGTYFSWQGVSIFETIKIEECIVFGDGSTAIKLSEGLWRYTLSQVQVGSDLPTETIKRWVAHESGK